MNKKIAIGVGVIIVIALLAGFFMRNKSANQVKNSMVLQTPQNEATQPQGMQNTLKGLLGLGQSQTCTYNVGEGLGTSTVYVASGKMRTDTLVKTGTTDFVSHTIMDGQSVYSWMDGQKTGYKMDFASMQGNTMKGDVNNSGQANIDPNKQFDFKCSSWSADSSKFTLPAGVEFNDMTKMMQDMQTNMPSGQTTPTPAAGTMPAGSMDAMCDSLQEPAKSQCLAALKGK